MRDAVPSSDGAISWTDPSGESTAWVDHLGGSQMSLGTYCIPAGGADDQMPHREDEVYVVTSGRAALLVDDQRLEVSAGSAVYVAAGQQHRFVDVTEDLTVVVVFSPPYSGR